MDAKVRRRSKKAILDATGMSEPEVEQVMVALDEFGEDLMKRIGDFVGQIYLDAADRGDAPKYLMAALGFFTGEVLQEVGIETMRKFLRIILNQLDKGFMTPAGLMWDKEPKKN